MKKTSRTKKAARAAPDLILPLAQASSRWPASLAPHALPRKLREARSRVRRRLRQAALELEILAILEEELLERFRLLCTRPTVRRDAP